MTKGRILSLLLAIVLGAQALAIPVFAQSEAEIYSDDKHSVNYDTIWYDPNLVVADECASGELSQIGVLVGKNNVEKAFNWLVGKGLTPEQAAGIVGNLIAESGVNPRVHQGHQNLGPEPVNGVGFGIAQWTYSDRQKPLVEFAKELNEPVNTLGPQLGYLWKELNTGYKSALSGIKNSKSVTEASTVFLTQFERPADQSASVQRYRGDLGEGVLKKYGGGSVGGTTDPTGNSCATNNGEAVSMNGFTFPLIITKAGIKKGADGAVWCYSATSSCHHDYPAADIHAATGTQVVAAKTGRVTSVTNSGTAAHLSIKSKDDGHLLFYQHLSAGSIPVRVGQSVNGGDNIGKVGDRADAYGTAPHLHFDMLPASFKYRPSCTGAGCSGLPLIDPQPVLHKLYQLLPER